MRSLHTAATGMRAMQMQIDNIANNLANVNTTAFKKNQMSFQDLMYQTFEEPGTRVLNDAIRPTGLQIGNGVRAVANNKIFTMGGIEETGNELDMMIIERSRGSVSFFQVLLPDGSIAYTRTGKFQLAEDGSLVTADGYFLEPNISVPENALEIQVTKEGVILALLDDAEAADEIGAFELARFINPAGLKALGTNLYARTEASGEPVLGTPGEEGFGTVLQGALEASNVQIVEEMVKMIQAQRAYELGAKAIQTAEDMLNTANGLKR